MEEKDKQIEAINTAVEHPEQLSESYSEEDGKKDTAIVKRQTAVKVAKVYAPAVFVGALSASAILKGHNIINKRYAGLSAAYTALGTDYKKYRNHVVDRFGEEVDKQLKFNTIKEEYTESAVDEETGKKKKVKKSRNIAQDGFACSGYAKFYQEGCLGWTKDPDHNLWVLRSIQSQANEALKSEGYLVLNDVYEMLGIDKTVAGQVVGWIYDEKNPVGDNYIDFGIYEVDDARKRDFVNGYERNILLDFNVDGNIHELLMSRQGLN